MPRVSKFEADFRQAFRCVETDKLDLALKIMRKEIDPWDVPLAQIVKRPWHKSHSLRMALLDRLLGTHGVESLGGDPDSHSKPPRWEYLNVGEAYAATVIWYRSSGRFYIRCYGDIVEAYRLK